MMYLEPFKLERYFAKYEFTTRYLLCSSDPESMTTADLLALEPGAQERYLNHWLGYTESIGAPTLRAEVAQIYTTISPDEILMFSGAEEAIFLFLMATLNNQDAHAIIHTPCYQSYTEVARGTGAQVSEWQAREESGWALDIDELRRLIRPNTKVILINTPHNPTGYLMSPDLFAQVNQIAQEHDILLFSDEVFRESEYGGPTLPAACDVNRSAISLGVLSKTYALPGLRIGWVATHNREIFNRMAALKDYTTICNSAPSEVLAEIALKHRQELAQRTVKRLRQNLALLDGFFTRHADMFSWQRPQASPMSFPKLLQGEIDHFADQLVREAGVLLLPGSVYGDTGNHFRLGFGRANMPEALAKLEAFIRH